MLHWSLEVQMIKSERKRQTYGSQIDRVLFKNELRKKKDKKEQNSAYLSQQDVSFRESRDRMVNCQTTWFEKPEFQV